MRKRNEIILGVIFIVLGVLLLLKKLGITVFNIDVFDVAFIISRFWPVIFMAIPGIAIHSIFFSGKSRDAGILVPGGILLTMGVVSQISMLFHIRGITMAGILIAVAVGLFEKYYFGTRSRAALVPVTIFTVLAAFSFVSNVFRWSYRYSSQLFFPILLVIIGILALTKNSRGGY